MKQFPTILIAFLAFTWCIYGVASAVMPPAYYEKQALNSKIKAIAVVEDVKVLARGMHHNRKKVVFRCEYALTQRVPIRFSGICASVDHFWQRPKVDGDIHYYPQKGARVFVTLTEDGGEITSYTIITEELENTVRRNPNKIQYSFGTAFVITYDRDNED